MTYHPFLKIQFSISIVPVYKQINVKIVLYILGVAFYLFLNKLYMGLVHSVGMEIHFKIGSDKFPTVREKPVKSHNPTD